MKIDYNELFSFTEELSDEMVYQLVNFFFNFALLFESMHIGKVHRYQKTLIEGYDPFEANCGEDNDPF